MGSWQLGKGVLKTRNGEMALRVRADMGYGCLLGLTIQLLRANHYPVSDI